MGTSFGSTLEDDNNSQNETFYKQPEITTNSKPKQQNFNSSASISESLSEKLELNFSVRNIPKLDLLSPSDPFIVVSIKDEINNKYNRVGKTEIIWDNPNADFSKVVVIKYKFEQVQHIRLDIYDADSEQINDLSKHDYIGHSEFIIGDLVTAHGQKLTMGIKNKYNKKLKKVNKMYPNVIVFAQEVDENYDEIEFELSSIGLPKMDTFGSIDPFIQIYRLTNDNSYASVYKSEHYRNTYKPNYKRFKIESRRLCHGDMNREILIKCWDWNRDARPDYACEIKTNLSQLIDLKQIKWKQYDNKKQKYTTKNCGKLLIKNINIIRKYSFVSFLKGGLEIQLMVAIDFTGSNGDPNKSTSLHYMGAPNYESQYLKVIKSVGKVLEPYDSDGQIAAYGFGANLNPIGNKQISHCFNLTLKSDMEEVNGINGLINAYKQCLNKIQLYGPTYFNEILNNAINNSIGICNQNKQQYNILLIITDGVINDMQRSCDSIVNATELPLSIIIVGVGNADFTNMEILDADDVPLKHSKTMKYMKRDIVQFVPYNEFKNRHISVIAKETLEEVPGQVTGFMSMHGISPKEVKYDDCKQDNIYDALQSNDMKQNESYINKHVVKKSQKNNDNTNISQPFNPYYGASAPYNPYQD